MLFGVWLHFYKSQFSVIFTSTFTSSGTCKEWFKFFIYFFEGIVIVLMHISLALPRILSLFFDGLGWTVRKARLYIIYKPLCWICPDIRYRIFSAKYRSSSCMKEETESRSGPLFRTNACMHACMNSYVSPELFPLSVQG